jgi:uroporphyrin-3 C-methyltransferase
VSSFEASPAPPPAPPPGPPPEAAAPDDTRRSLPVGLWVVVALAALLAAGGLYSGWQAQQRVQALELELVRRQQDTGTAATEARVLANQAQDAARDAVAKVALLEARLAETTAQSSQVEDLLRSIARSRDDSALADLEATLRLATQHAALTGSSETLVLTLRQADERLVALNQPRLERVRRALARDIERLTAAGSTDIAVLSLRIDEVIRQVDELPLLAMPEPRTGAAAPQRGDAPRPEAAEAPAPDAAASDAWFDRLPQASREFATRFWSEARSLLRITRIEHPEALLLAPEQAYFVRQNLRLRLLNARLALLSRQFDVAQADLRDAQAMLERYFDRQSRRVQGASELLRQVAQQSRAVTVPRPDETLAALAAAAAGR